MNSSKGFLLVIYPLRSSFVLQDIEALKGHHNIREFAFGMPKGLLHIRRQLALVWFIFRNLTKIKGIFCWFGDYHSVFPAIIGKCFQIPFILAIGGYDAANLPEWNYGGHRKRFRSMCIKLSYQLATKVIYSSHFTKAQMHFRLKPSHIRPQIEQVVYPGLLPVSTIISNITRKYRMIYVAAGNDVGRMHIKGVDRFIEIARNLSQFKFLLIGPSSKAFDWALIQAPSNLTILGPQEPDALADYYRQSEMIALFSRFEAFGMVLLEGMYQGCLPLTLANLGSSEIIDSQGPGKVFDGFEINQICAFVADFQYYKIDSASLYLRAQQFRPESRAEAIQHIFA